LARTRADAAKVTSSRDGQEDAAKIGRPEASRVTGAEARKLDHLGRKLRDSRDRPDPAKRRQDLIRQRKMLRDKARRARPVRPNPPDDQ
jgi:hypothetical protein